MSNTNFVFLNIGRPAAEFRDACAKRNVFVARDFPPMEKTHARVTIGTMDEMKKAMEVFREVLATRDDGSRRAIVESSQRFSSSGRQHDARFPSDQRQRELIARRGGTGVISNRMRMAGILLPG